ncbi:MAG: mycothiol transferase [Candidatus Dormibacteria bacterium]
MTSAEVLADSFGRIRDIVHRVVDGLSRDQLAARLDSEANSIGWLVWHLTRIQDDHIAGVAGSEQIWVSAGWANRFGLPLDAADTGFGHTPPEVAAVIVDAEPLRDYFDAVHEVTLAFLGTLTDAGLDRIVDERWDPPVTLGVRLVSIIVDDVQHAGQAAYIRGILERR